jgi:hypothetical protein
MNTKTITNKWTKRTFSVGDACVVPTGEYIAGYKMHENAVLERCRATSISRHSSPLHVRL